LRARRSSFDQAGADLRGDAQILVLDAPREIVAPGKEMIHPGGDRVFVAADRGRDKAALPAIVAQ